VLPWDQGGNRPLMDARLHLRRAASSCDVVICDLTWSDSMADELLFEFDAVIVPTSIAEIELASTARFLNNRRWVFDTKNKDCPDLLLCPSRVHNYQLENNAFLQQRFAVSFLLSPPVLESQSAKDCYENGYLMDLANECGFSFVEFAKALNVTRELRGSRQALNQFNNFEHLESKDRPHLAHRVASLMPSGHGKQHVMAKLTGRSSILGRHRFNKNVADSNSIQRTVSEAEQERKRNTQSRGGLNQSQERGLAGFMKIFKRSTTT
jgi:hypothetical protein